jgi:hypothetical protein
MLHDHLETPTSVDAKTAEEALALAVRLQQERGERVSIEELQRTADEAGIDRDCLEGALRQVTQKAKETEQVAVRQTTRFTVMAVAMSIAVLIAVIGRVAPEVIDSPFFFVAVIGGAFLVRCSLRKCGLLCSTRRLRDR